MSARYPSDIAWRVIDDAEARGVKPGVILRKIVEAHYATLDAASDESITVRPADISIVGWVGGVLETPPTELASAAHGVLGDQI
ncbi:hypothetical protein [Micromonospora sp. NPDC048063]|uniref:hypothetical protein n=1 Tax=Micromonospora sp. NPDC048063 TaxID=3364256 RepID=UPI00371557E4